MPDMPASSRIVVIWIDWYPYHVARFKGLCTAHKIRGSVSGIELVGGIGVHAGLKFREALPVDLNIETLMPDSSWRDVNKLRLARMLWRKLSELDPTTVLIPGYYTLPGIAAALWAKLHGAQSVLMTESTSFDHPRVSWKEWIKGTGVRMLFDWAVAGGKAHFDYLRQLGFRMDRVTDFYDVVDNDLFRDGAFAHRSQSSSQPYFLYVGRLAQEKNVLGLLASWMTYRGEGGKWPLVLVGDGPESAALREAVRVSSYGSEVHLPGLKASQELLPFYADAGCFVLPSTREPWGLVVNEAMSAKLPVLVSNRCGCAADLVRSGQNGFLFDPEDRAALTSLLHTVDRLSSDDRHAMGLCSAEIIRDYTPLAFGNSVSRIAAGGGRTIPLSLPAHVGSEPISGGS